jgi:branched-chain amino acid aminotransferase
MLAIDTAEAVKSAARPATPDEIDFGKTFTGNFFIMEHLHGRWQNARIESLDKFRIHPAAVVFHYGQAIFEGLKAYRQPGGGIALFRAEMNARRLNSSAERLDMPTVEEEHFFDAVSTLVRLERDSVMPPPGSLYLRPTMVGSEPCIRVSSANEYIFYILALPAGPYFKGATAGPGSIDVLVTRKVVRASRGGTGAAKTSANYAGTLGIIAEAKKIGCSQVLFLNAHEGDLVEEMGGMNVFFVVDGVMVTPPLDGVILPGITRDSVIRLAKDLDIRCEEKPVSIQAIEDGIQSGAVTEAIACGTAATVTCIGALHFEDGRALEIGDRTAGPITRKLYSRLMAIQYGEAPDTHEWIREIVAP